MLTPFIFHILHHFQWLIKHKLLSARISPDTWNANTAICTSTSTTTEHILIRWTTVKRMSKLQHIKLNETENRTKLHHILSSEIQDQVTARYLDNNKTKNHVTAYTPNQSETQHQVT